MRFNVEVPLLYAEIPKSNFFMFAGFNITSVFMTGILQKWPAKTVFSGSSCPTGRYCFFRGLQFRLRDSFCWVEWNGISMEFRFVFKASPHSSHEYNSHGFIMGPNNFRYELVVFSFDSNNKFDFYLFKQKESKHTV